MGFLGSGWGFGPAAVSGSTSSTFTAICPVGVSVGKWVCITGLKIGGDYQVDLADPTLASKVPAVGLVISKPTTTTCVVQWFGFCRGYLTGLTPGNVLWLDVAGGTRTTPHTSYSQALGVATDTTEALIEPDWPVEPIATYASHYNTVDGNTTATVADISAISRYVSNPSGHFNIGDWVAGTAHNTTRTSPLVYSTVNPCSILNNTSTTFKVTVYDADGSTELASHQITLTGNGMWTVSNITITVANWAADDTKFKARIDASIDVSTILSTGGRFSVKLEHVDGTDGTFTKTQNNIFFDEETNATSLTGVSIGETLGSVVTLFLSGVEYYTLGSQFTVDITDIDNLNDESYPLTQVNIDGSEYALPTLDLQGSGLTGWTNAWDDIDDSYQKTNWAITTPNITLRTTTANIQARTQDWAAGSWVPSSDNTILIETHSDTNTRLVERFFGESWRCASGANFNAGGAKGWTSSNDLGAGDALFYNGGCERNTENWQTWNPNSGTQPDYSASQNATVYLIREFQHDGSASSGFTLNITGTYASLEYKLAKAWDGLPSGGTVWINALAAYNAALWNNGSPTGGSGGSTGGSHYSLGTNNIINCSDTLYVKIGFTGSQRITALSVTFD